MKSILFAFFLFAAVADALGAPRNAIHIKEISKMLSSKPHRFVPSINDRKAWTILAKRPQLESIVESATKTVNKKLPVITDELFLEFSRNGNRTRWQDANNKYKSRLRVMVLAECVENKGRFLGGIEKLIKHFCEKRTWLMPAHDRSLRNFHQKTIDIDLGSAMFAWTMATIDSMLGDKLKTTTRKIIRRNLEKRVYAPFEAMVNGEREKNWWLNTTNNWNAVCLAGVVGAALPIIESQERRAFFIAAAERYINNFLNGFTPDGNCSEGLSYWNYGFGHFIMLSETISKATGGRVRLMNNLKAEKPALYGFRSQIQDGLYPAFADCGINAKPDENLLLYINNYYGLKLKALEGKQFQLKGELYSMLLFASQKQSSTTFQSEMAFNPNPHRTFFPDAGIYIGRKTETKPVDKLAMACKGGHNAEHHNHNDVGTFIVAVDGTPVLCDPGSEVYTARTFSKDRYKSKVLNSFGHPVPLIAGKMQKTGNNRKGIILRTSFTKEKDVILLDMKSAYDVPELRKLEREYAYSRKGDGSLTITDTVEFSKPQSYETALITFGDWEKNKDGSFFVYYQDKAVNVAIDAGDEICEIRGEILHEDVRENTLPTRIGFKLKTPVKSAKFIFTITPAKAEKTGNLLKNGDFRHKSFAWEIPVPGMGGISKERSFEGRYSLKISDNSSCDGSNISSAKISIQNPGEYRLIGKYFPLSGKGLGIYMKYYDANGKMLNTTSKCGYIRPIGSLGGASKQWEEFNFNFTIPKGTRHAVLWIHSYTTALVEGYLDDIVFHELKIP